MKRMSQPSYRARRPRIAAQPQLPLANDDVTLVTDLTHPKVGELQTGLLCGTIGADLGVRANIHLGGQTEFCPNGERKLFEADQIRWGGGVVAEIFRDLQKRTRIFFR